MMELHGTSFPDDGMQATTNEFTYSVYSVTLMITLADLILFKILSHESPVTLRDGLTICVSLVTPKNR